MFPMKLLFQVGGAIFVSKQYTWRYTIVIEKA